MASKNILTCKLVHKITGFSSNHVKRTFPVLKHQNARASLVLSQSFATQQSSSSTKVQRGSYAKLEDSDVAFFRRILGTTRVLTGAEESLDGYNEDWLKSVKGSNLGHLFVDRK